MIPNVSARFARLHLFFCNIWGEMSRQLPGVEPEGATSEDRFQLKMEFLGLQIL
jgi:hypothetical protein